MNSTPAVFPVRCPRSRVRRTFLPLVVAGLVLLVAGAAGAQGTPPLDRIAILPLTNLSGTPDAATLFEQLLTAAMAGRGPVVENGVVGAVMDSLRLRPTVSPSPEDVRQLKGALGVRFLVTGCVLEHGTLQTPDSRYPCSGVVLKVLDVDSTRIAWAGSRFRCGDDKERIFGWGRDFDPNSVAMRLTADLAEEVRRVVWPALERDRKGTSR